MWTRWLLVGALWLSVEGGALALEGSQGAAEPERYEAVPELSVGEMDGPVTLTRVEHIVLDGSRVFVSQPAEHLIRVLSAESGELLAEWGQAGDGPGDIRRLTWLGLFGDTVVVFDDRLRRLTAFRDDGSVTRTRRLVLPPVSLPRFWAPMAITREGHMLAIEAFGILPGQVEEPSGTDPWMLLDPSGAVLDTLPQFRDGDRYIVLRRERGTSSIQRPIHGGDRWAMAVDGSRWVVAGDHHGEGLSLRVYVTAEQVTHPVELQIPPVPLDRHTADSIMTPLRNAILERGLAQGVDRRDLEEALAAPEWVPAVDEMFVTADGEVWLREPAFSGPYHLWRVVAPDGAITAEVEVPFGTVLRDRAGEHLWGYRVDPQFGFYTVERLRLERIDAGSEQRAELEGGGAPVSGQITSPQGCGSGSSGPPRR